MEKEGSPEFLEINGRLRVDNRDFENQLGC